MTTTTLVKFGFHKNEAWERGYAREDRSLRACLDTRFDTYSIKTLTGLIQRRGLAEGEALSYLAGGGGALFRVINCPKGD